jgi:aryl-alcohol dehydrogenase-like predicted oxidoreductase
VCLGTMTWGGKGFWEVVGKLDLGAAEKHLRTSLDAGVNFIDTANVYHEGLSEDILGKAIASLGLHRHELVLATKVRGRVGTGPNQVGLTRTHILHQIEESLRRIGTDYIDLYQIHGVDPVTPIEETLRALDDLVHSGKVRTLGVSNHAAWQIMKALGISAREGLSRFESIQAYYSIAGRDLEREIVPLAQDQGLAILPWSPLAGGLLSGKFSRGQKGPDGARRATFDFPPVDMDRGFACVDAMREVAEAHDCSVARVALAWCLHQPWCTSIIIGAKTDDQLADNLASTELKLTQGELEKLDAVSALPPEYPGWMIARQTQDRKLG